MRMRRWSAASLAAFLTALGAGTVRAETPEVTHDLRCFVAAVAATESNDAKMKQAGLSMAVYFLGRLDAGAPAMDLTPRIIETLQTRSADDIRQDIKDCGQILAARGAALTALGEAMNKSMSAAPPAKP